MACTNEDCPVNVFKTCSFAPTIVAEAGYAKVLSYWQTLAKQYNAQGRDPVTAEGLRDRQSASVKARANQYISEHCRPEDVALRDALRAFDN